MWTANVSIRGGEDICPHIPIHELISMAPRIGSLYKNKNLRTILGTLGVLTAFVVFTEMTLRTIVPVAFIFFAVMGHDVVDETYDLPEGTNWFAYGASVVVVGAYFAVAGPTPWVGSLIALAGLWFVFDGATTIRYEPSLPTHEYVADIDDTDMGEAMLHMQTLNVVYQGLEDAPEPKTATELAADLDLTESRVERALEFLDTKGRVEQMGNQYRAEPPQWGWVTPVVQFFAWLPRRIVRPFRRVAANA